ncbi:MAG: DUF3604 domain-containing protein [Xanthobacteraceae bacterium]
MASTAPMRRNGVCLPMMAGFTACVLLLSASAHAEELRLLGASPAIQKEQARIKEAEAKVRSNPLRDVYFGETHVHTAYSLDAFIGGARLTPDAAYRFAQGEKMTVNGQMHRIAEPLDFAAVTDHAEYLGEMQTTLVAGTPGHDSDQVKTLRGLKSVEEREQWFLNYVVKSNRSSTPQHPPFYAGPETTKSAWVVVMEATERNYKPGKFTTIPAFEWSAAPKGGNLHRNVFFRDMRVPELPMSYIDINREDGLWAWMGRLQKQGVSVFAIPHNSNASKLMMFDPNTPEGKPIDSDYVRTRAHFEPLIEMMQVKGNSEVHRYFWGQDEFADFENADSMAKYSGRETKRENFVRYGLIKGLEYERSLGANPYKYGIAGGTDSHNGTPGDTDERNFVGSHGAADDTVDARRKAEVGGWIAGIDLSPGALTGVWAASNTRGAIWDAMRRKETFGTSGVRIRVRMFAGFGLPGPDANDQSTVATGYQQGVPMGGDLPTVAPGEKRPLRFNVLAMKGAKDANLDRIQIIKGWIGKDGMPQEKIVNVAWSDDRKPGADGKLPPVGNTVDVKTASFTNAIGATELRGSWTDDEFDPSQNALYYARVLQIPTPRWSTYDAARAKLPVPAGVAATVQERAWTSPIWYTAAK